MDLLIGIAIGSFVTNMTNLSIQRGGTLPEEMLAVNSIVRKKLQNQPRIGKFITPFIDRVQPQSTKELQELVNKWCETPDAEKPPRQDKQHISNWDTSLITNMSLLFSDQQTFNDDISQWNTSNVTNMSAMFSGALAFNQPIGVWNTSNVTNMSSMFSGASNFNQLIGDWDTSNVTDMSWMFQDAKAFNQPIGNWNTSKVTDMSRMFESNKGWFVSNQEGVNQYQEIQANAFNQDISRWNTSNVTNMRLMFRGAKNFKQNLDTWDVDNVTDMMHMFYLVDRIPNWPYKSDRKQSQLKAVYVLKEDDVEELIEDLRQEFSNTEVNPNFVNIRTMLKVFKSTHRYIQDTRGDIHDLAQKNALYEYLLEDMKQELRMYL